MKSLILNFLRRQDFNPTLAGIFVNPFYFARSSLWRGIAANSHMLSGNLLDVGCGSKPYQTLFKVDKYTGLDIDLPQVRNRGIADCFYGGRKFPFDDGEFDSVLCNQVFEHVFNPDEFLLEIHRVLKPGGVLLLTVPFVWDEHEQPYDYARYSSFGLRYLLNKAGYEIVHLDKLGDDISIIFQMLNMYIYKRIVLYPNIIRFIITISVMASINIIGYLGRMFSSRNPDLYLDNLVVAKRSA